MASEGSTQAIIKRREDDLAVMPPPPVKRIKRPTEVLDEDEYTDALSDIIARDYYPGLREGRAQEEYLQALDSRNSRWIAEAEKELRAANDGKIEVLKKPRRETRDTRFDTPRSYRQAADTPRVHSGAETPDKVAATASKDEDENDTKKPDLDTSTLSLSSYQAKYTSEDNASFNTLLDKQNEKRRQKHAHLWTQDQRIPSQCLLAHRTQQQQLLKDKIAYKATNGKELIPLTVGATDTRSAKPNAWKISTPANTFMFMPSTSVDEQGLKTTTDLKERMSKAGPKEIVHANTRFPPSGPQWESAGDDDDATSIHTSVIARRNVVGTDADIGGAETPRVNGYAFVDDEEPPPAVQMNGTSYRDLLAGQVGDEVPNPFALREAGAREDLHYRIVERDAEKKRVKEREVVRGGKEIGNMTPAARKMMERLGGRTPVVGGVRKQSGREDWTPVATPRRNRAAV